MPRFASSKLTQDGHVEKSVFWKQGAFPCPCGLLGCLVGWPVGGFVGWLVGSLVGSLVGWLVLVFARVLVLVLVYVVARLPSCLVLW